MFSLVSFALYFLATFVMLALLPSVTSGRLRYYSCFIFYGVAESVIALLLTPLTMFYFRDPRTLGMASDVIRSISYPLGITWEVRNAEKLRKGTRAIVVANHQSVLDILGLQYLHRYMGTYTTLSKKELLYLGPWGLSAWLGGLIFLDRTNRESKMAAMKEAANHFRRGVKILFFAEGTRNYSQQGLLPFKKGAFQMAECCETNIIPVVFSPFSFIDHEKKEFNKGRVIISVLDEIAINGSTIINAEQLSDETHRRMSEEYRRLVTETARTS